MTDNSAPADNDAPVLKRSEASATGDVPDKGRTAVWILIDRSGSMSGMESAVVQGVGDLIDEQTTGPGKCRITVAQFDGEEPFDVLVDCRPAAEVDKGALDGYSPRGLTPLYDAIGAIITRADKRVQRREKADKKAENQIVVIVTDGMENDSSDYSAKDIREMIKERRSAGWGFVFLGANQDAYEEGGRLGVSMANTQNYSHSDEGYKTAFSSVSRGISGSRGRLAADGARAASAGNDDLFEGVKEAEDQLSSQS